MHRDESATKSRRVSHQQRQQAQSAWHGVRQVKRARKQKERGKGGLTKKQELSAWHGVTCVRQVKDAAKLNVHGTATLNHRVEAAKSSLYGVRFVQQVKDAVSF